MAPHGSIAQAQISNRFVFMLINYRHTKRRRNSEDIFTRDSVLLHCQFARWTGLQPHKENNLCGSFHRAMLRDTQKPLFPFITRAGRRRLQPLHGMAVLYISIIIKLLSQGIVRLDEKHNRSAFFVRILLISDGSRISVNRTPSDNSPLYRNTAGEGLHSLSTDIVRGLHARDRCR